MKPVLNQQPAHGLGNTINMTPAVQMLSEYLGERIDFYFGAKWIYDLYKDWDCINAFYARALPGKINMDTAEPTRHSNTKYPDWLFLMNLAYDRFLKGKNVKFTDYKTFVPQSTPEDNNGKIVVVHGCANNSIHRKDKTIAQSSYISCLDKLVELDGCNYDLVFVGSEEDYDLRFRTILDNYHARVDLLFGDHTSFAIAEIATCDFVISNDTGLMHVATALEKPCFAFWKDTPWVRQRPINKTTIRAKKDKWEETFDEFLDVYTDKYELSLLFDSIEGKL
tara:strand:- start:19763 stop:20602 length:840 start_codon:yes stop_codon:yes gene_type:complete